MRDKTLQILNRPFPKEADASRKQLVALGSPAIPYIVEAIRSDVNVSPIKKAFLIDVMSGMGDQDAAYALIKLLGDGDPIVRGLSASRLGKLKSKAAIPHLVNLLRDNEVYQTIAQTDPATEEDILVRDVAIEALQATTGIVLAQRGGKDEQVKAWVSWWQSQQESKRNGRPRASHSRSPNDGGPLADSGLAE